MHIGSTIIMGMLGAAVVTGGVLSAPRTGRATDAAAEWTPARAQFIRAEQVPSHNRRYLASLAFDSAAGRDGFSGHITLTTGDGRVVTGARLALDTSMPDDETVTMARPVMTEELGGGVYRVRGMRFDRDGWYAVRLNIAAPLGGDSLAFNLIR